MNLPHLLGTAILPLLLFASCSFDAGQFAGNAAATSTSSSPEPGDREMGDEAQPGDMAPAAGRDAGVLADMSVAVRDMATGADGAVPEDMRFGKEDMVQEGEDMGVNQLSCEGNPIDPLSDPDHCGGCGNGCDPSFGECAGGVCRCVASGMQSCGNQNRCEDFMSDPNHCGGCGRACDASSWCQGGACVCRPGYTECGGRCVNLAQDPNHCGRCGQGCRDREVCDEGKCERRCSWKRTCEHPDGGTSCVSGGQDDGFTPEFCINVFGCGESCGAAEVCAKEPGNFFSERECRALRTGRGCTSCPCADCTSSEFCLSQDGVPLVWCVTS